MTRIGPLKSCPEPCRNCTGPCPGYGTRSICPPLIVLVVAANPSLAHA
jgi:predicted metal-binding protein